MAIKVSKAGRVQPGDRVIDEDGPLFVSRVVKSQGRKPARGENLRILGYDTVTARKHREIAINSCDTIKIMGRPLTTA